MPSAEKQTIDGVRSQRADCIRLQFGSRDGHDDVSLTTQMTGTEGDPLGMVPRRGANDTSGEFRR